MKFKAAIIASVVLHISVFAIALYVPMKSTHQGTVYYVDLISMPGGGGGGGGDKAQKGGGQPVQEPQRMKDLTTQKEEVQSQFRYPDEDKKSKKKPEKEKQKTEKKELITMTRKDWNKEKSPAAVTGQGDNVLKTGISAGGGGGSGGGYGGGTGSGYGPGTGTGTGFFPYAYYIETLKNKVSSSWYSGLVSPGQRGQFLVVVDFKILRDGRIQDLKIAQNSGIRSLDLSALRAIENSAPFPPLPGDYPYSYLPISFDFVWGKK